MPRRASMTNVRRHLEDTYHTMRDVLDGGRLTVPEALACRRIMMMSDALLRLHSEKAAGGDRHDIYVERRTGR